MRLHSQNGISSTILDNSQPKLTADSSSDTTGITFIGSIDFIPCITASVSFFKMQVPIASISFRTGLTATVNTLTGDSKAVCRLFNLAAVGNFKGSIGNHSRNLLNPLSKILKHGCIG